MTTVSLQNVITEAGKSAQVIADENPATSVVANEAAVAQWMQVKMLAEIALQLRIMNAGAGNLQPED